jgi:hypothetical protein
MVWPLRRENKKKNNTQNAKKQRGNHTHTQTEKKREEIKCGDPGLTTVVAGFGGGAR